MRRDIFQALADPTRRAIILLLTTQVLTPNNIAEHFNITRQAVSKHLILLAECDVLRQEQKGREIYYHLNSHKMKELEAYLAEFKKLMSTKFDQLDNVLLKLKSNKIK
ncbi:MAG: metalloregulator ArsR/SmtB family transcription factor [Saprospiraceae bacterium]